MSIKFGDLIENNVKSKKDFERLLTKKGIVDVEERKEYLENYEKMTDSMKAIAENFSKNILLFREILQKFTINFKPVIDTPISFAEILKPLYEIFTEFSKKLEQVIPIEWSTKLVLELKKIKKKDIKKLIKAYTIFKSQIIIYMNNRDKRLIIFSEYILYLSSIFENYTKNLIKLFKRQPEELKKRIYRAELESSIKEFYDPVEINFGSLFSYLYDIADNIKHEYPKFLKRFSKYTCLELLNESNKLFLELKLYLKKSLVSFYILQVRLYHQNLK